eukprot:GGOE01001593.1.p1 GENE.GGOE01001593.1~~GGOE01001593.1.p1  ORF type:complete len:462 (-),score=100.87 GGOE01001593.1:344-1729(-)
MLFAVENSHNELLAPSKRSVQHTRAVCGGILGVVALALLWCISLVSSHRPVVPTRFVLLPGLRPVPLLHPAPPGVLPRHFPRLDAAVAWGRQRFELRSGGGVEGDVGPGRELEAIHRMHIRAMKEELQLWNVGCDDCLEKSDLAQRLLSVVQQANRDGGILLQMPVVCGQSGCMGPNLTADEGNQYFTFDVQFPRSANPMHTAQLVVDTAATVSLISPEASHLYGGRPTGNTASGTAAGGDAATAGYQVSLGPIVVDDRPFNLDFRPVVAGVPLITSRTQGILGLDFFSRFDVFFDFAGAQCELFPRGSTKFSDRTVGMRAVPYRVLPLGLLVANLRLVLNGTSGTIVLGILDTGAGSSVMNWKAASTVGLNRSSPEVANTGLIMVGQDGNVMPMSEVDVDVIIGKNEERIPIRVGVADLPGFHQMGLKPVMLVGADVWKGCGSMLLSMADRQFWVPDHST